MVESDDDTVLVDLDHPWGIATTAGPPSPSSCPRSCVGVRQASATISVARFRGREPGGSAQATSASVSALAPVSVGAGRNMLSTDCFTPSLWFATPRRHVVWCGKLAAAYGS